MNRIVNAILLLILVILSFGCSTNQHDRKTHIVKTSPFYGETKVRPGDQKITFIFSRNIAKESMSLFMSKGQANGDLEMNFDKTRVVIAAKLEPNMDYEFKVAPPELPPFLDERGIPIEEYTLRFSTSD